MDLGGIFSPESATATNSSMDVGNMENATSISVSHRLSNSFNPLIPPTKSILELVLGSSIPKMGFKTKSCNIDASKDFTMSVSINESFIFSLYHCPSKKSPKYPFPSGE